MDEKSRRRDRRHFVGREKRADISPIEDVDLAATVASFNFLFSSPKLRPPAVNLLHRVFTPARDFFFPSRFERPPWRAIRERRESDSVPTGHCLPSRKLVSGADAPGDRRLILFACLFSFRFSYSLFSRVACHPFNHNSRALTVEDRIVRLHCQFRDGENVGNLIHSVKIGSLGEWGGTGGTTPPHIEIQQVNFMNKG